MLEVNKLSHQYRFGSLSFSNLSFSVTEGEILCLYGKEESGKSSILHVLSGLLPVKKGSILYKDKDITASGAQERDFCLLHNTGGFFEHKTVEYNLCYPLFVRKENKEKVSAQLSFVSEKFSLDETFLKAKVKELDSDQRIKLAICRLFMRKANAYLLDDPFTKSSDRAQSFNDFYPYIIELSQKAPVVYATSDINEVFFLNGKTVILNYGVVEQKGYFAEMRKNPATVYVYELLFDNVVKEEGIIKKGENDEIYLETSTKVFPLEKNGLINDVYIDCSVLVCSNSGSNYTIYDKNCERLIYFKETN